MSSVLTSIENTHSYFRFADKINNRLDVQYNDELFEIIGELIAKSPFTFVELKEVVDFSKELRNPRKNPDEEFLYVDIGSINTTKGIPQPERMFGSEAKSSRIRKVMIKGSVLVSTTRPTRNAICTVPNELDDHICSTGFAVLVPKKGMLNKFLFYTLRSEICTRQFARYCSGSGYPAINQEIDLPEVLVPKPPEDIQKRIVEEINPLEKEALELESKKEKLKEEIDNLLLYYLNFQLDKSLNLYFFKSGSEGQSITFHTFPEEIEDRMHYLFYHPKYEILDELKNKYKVVELNEVKKEPIIRGEQPEYSEVGVMVIKTVDLKNEYIDYENCLKVSEEFFEEYAEKHPEGVLRKGDILIASTGYVSMGKVDIYEREEPAMADGHISILRVKSGYDPYFIVYYLRSHFGQIQFDKWWSGSSGQIEIQPQDLEWFLIPESSEEGIPLEKQKEIAQRITEKLNDVFELEKKAKEKWEEAKRLFEKMILGGIDDVGAEQHTLTSFTGVSNQLEIYK